MTDERELMRYVAGAPGTWLREYLEYARSVTDAPLAFHVGGGLAAMAGAIGSNVSWYGGGHREQWPNLFLLLLAPSGIFRKSTSVDISGNLLERARPGSILDREYSPERFLRNLADNPTSMLKESEFSSLLERMKSNYMQGMKQRLTDLYDCQPSYDRVIQGMNGKGERISIVRPSLSILAASTLDWLVESLTETDMRSGFMPRFLFIAPTLKETEPAGGYLAEGNRANESALIKGLAGLGRMPKADVSFGPAKRTLVAWTADRTSEAESGDTPEELSGLYSRIGHHVSKLAVLMTISDDSIAKHYEVSVDAAERAMALLEWILVSTARVFEERVTFSKFEQQAQKTLRFIGGGIERGSLLKKMKVPASELDRLLITLKERHEIDERSESSGGRPRKVITRTIEGTARILGEERGTKGEVSGEESPNGRIVSFAPSALVGK